MDDISCSTTLQQDIHFLSNEANDDRASSLSFLNTSQYQHPQQQQHYRANRESPKLDDGDEHPLYNERPSKKDVPWYGQGGRYATDASTLKVHQPETTDTSDHGLGPKMSRYISQGTPPPPPPVNRSKPGAVRIPGFQTESSNITAVPAIDSSSQSEPSKSSAPILQASVVNDEQEQPSSPGGTLPVLAEPMKDGESSERSCSDMLKDRRLLALLIILVVIIIAFAVGVTLVLMNKETTITTTTVEYIPATPAPTMATLAPSTAPTEALEFLPPSFAQCLEIEAGDQVANQDQMILKTYQIELDVVLESNPANDVGSLNTLATSMQETLAPKLAQCDIIFDHQRRRRLRGDYSRRIRVGQRKLVSDFLVANAKFSNPIVANNRSCKVGALEPCYKVIETVDLYIKQDELDVRIISLIMDAFDGESLVELLDLGYPFNSIDMIGVTSSTDGANANSMQEDSPDDDED